MSEQSVSYEEHLAFLERQIEGALWEKRGFVDAKLTISPVLPDDPYQCVRYKQGFYSGQAKLMVAEVHA